MHKYRSISIKIALVGIFLALWIWYQKDTYTQYQEQRLFAQLAPMQISTEQIQEYQEHCMQAQEPCMVLPHQQLIATLSWIQNIQYFGSYVETGKNEKVTGLLDQLTTLSPYWTYPYVF